MPAREKCERVFEESAKSKMVKFIANLWGGYNSRNL